MMKLSPTPPTRKHLERFFQTAMETRPLGDGRRGSCRLMTLIEEASKWGSEAGEISGERVAALCWGGPAEVLESRC
jgi:hypothetical protein